MNDFPPSPVAFSSATSAASVSLSLKFFKSKLPFPTTLFPNSLLNILE